MKTIKIGIQLTESSHRMLTALTKPAVWHAYKMHTLKAITEGAKSSIQHHAASLWKNPTGQLDNSWFTKYDFGRMVGTIYNTKHYAYYLNFGVRPHQMTYLLNAKVKTYMAWGQYPYQARSAIPVQIDGNLGFRRPTVEAMQAGKWQHPGYPGKSFVEHGMDLYKTNLMPQDVSGLLVKVIDTK